MVSPGKLRALRELKDGPTDAFEPSVGETGTVTYPAVEAALDEGDRDEFLETMTDRGLLESDFEYKVYICPHCAVEGMQYSTGCPDCGSVHAIEEPVAVHTACETLIEAHESDPGADETLHCPDCEEAVAADEVDHDRQYHCQDCDLWFESPTHRLWCRDCDRVYPPEAVREEPLVRYPLSNTGYRWVTEQLERRQLLAETLEARGYDTTVDTTVNGEVPVHVYAVDDLFDDRLVAGVHSSPTVEDVDRLCKAARDVDGQPLLLLTDGSVDERVSDRLEAESVTVLSGADGMLSKEYDTRDRSDTQGPIAEWLDSLFSPSNSRR